MTFAERFVERFRWIGGHADVLGLLADGVFLRDAAAALAEPFRSDRVTKVAGVEARGFVLGAAVALELGVGFVPIRKSGAIHPGPKAVVRTERDWRGNQHELSVQRAALTADGAVLLVDDWVETASQSRAARTRIEECGARWAGLSVLVDQTTPDMRALLEPVRAVVRSDELPPSHRPGA